MTASQSTRKAASSTAPSTAEPREDRASAPRGRGRGRRVTIADIAERAGVTAAAVSLAVNGRPGVSDATRARIVEIARELNWMPSHAARALAGAPVLTIGMVLARPADVLGSEAFFGGFIAGLQEVLSARDYSLQMKIVENTDAEIETYRRWFGQRRVDGVILLDLRVDDPRVPVLEQLGQPALVVGGPGHHGTLPAVYADDAFVTSLLVEHLAKAGHRRIARLAGAGEYLHTATRDATFAALCAEHGIAPILHEAGFTAYGAATATAELLRTGDAPTAIIYDSDEMALGGARVIAQQGLRIPQDIAIASYEDSAMMRSHRPRITAVSRSAVEYGRLAARRMLQIITDRSTEATAQTHGEEHQAADDGLVPTLEVRGSTDPTADDEINARLAGLASS